jgi:hypothetical protein
MEQQVESYKQDLATSRADRERLAKEVSELEMKLREDLGEGGNVSDIVRENQRLKDECDVKRIEVAAAKLKVQAALQEVKIQAPDPQCQILNTEVQAALHEVNRTKP